MTGVFILFHSIACVFLIIVILMQSGRGGGLTEAFVSAESMFGAKTNEILVRATAGIALVFLITSLTLAHLSSKKDRSLMTGLETSQEINLPEVPTDQDVLLPDVVE